MKKYYTLTRALHLYVGLFISPIILIFSISVLVFNHPAVINSFQPIKVLPEIRTRLDKTPVDTTDLAVAIAITKKLNIKGDIEFISKTDSSFSFPVNKPGLRTNIKVNTKNDSVLITQKNEGLFRSLSYLHSMPGPHNVKIRGNTAFMKTWRVLADVVVYLLLFLTLTGILLWYILKVERVIGIYSLALGIVVFIALMTFIFN